MAILDKNTVPSTDSSVRTQARAFQWIRDNFVATEYPFDCILKSEIYSSYCESCAKSGCQAVILADFGKIMRQALPSVFSKRIGQRGNSKYYFVRIKRRSDLSVNEINQPTTTRTTTPVSTVQRQEVTATGKSQRNEEKTDETDEEPTNNERAASVVMEWASKLLGRPFPSLISLARFLIFNKYVSGRTSAAYALVQAFDQQADELKDPSAASSDSAPPATGSIEPHREVQLQLQKALLSRRNKEPAVERQPHQTEADFNRVQEIIDNVRYESSTAQVASSPQKTSSISVDGHRSAFQKVEQWQAEVGPVATVLPTTAASTVSWIPVLPATSSQTFQTIQISPVNVVPSGGNVLTNSASAIPVQAHLPLVNQPATMTVSPPVEITSPAFAGSPTALFDSVAAGAHYVPFDTAAESSQTSCQPSTADGTLDDGRNDYRLGFDQLSPPKHGLPTAQSTTPGPATTPDLMTPFDLNEILDDIQADQEMNDLMNEFFPIELAGSGSPFLAAAAARHPSSNCSELKDDGVFVRPLAVTAKPATAGRSSTTGPTETFITANPCKVYRCQSCVSGSLSGHWSAGEDNFNPQPTAANMAGIQSRKRPNSSASNQPVQSHSRCASRCGETGIAGPAGWHDRPSPLLFGSTLSGRLEAPMAVPPSCR